MKKFAHSCIWVLGWGSLYGKVSMWTGKSWGGDQGQSRMGRGSSHDLSLTNGIMGSDHMGTPD